MLLLFLSYESVIETCNNNNIMRICSFFFHRISRRNYIRPEYHTIYNNNIINITYLRASVQAKRN